MSVVNFSYLFIGFALGVILTIVLIVLLLDNKKV